MTDTPDRVPSPTGVAWIDVLVLLAAVVTAAGILWRPVRAAIRVLRKIDAFLRDWNGDARSGVPPRPGVLCRLDHIETELKANGGRTLRDRVDEIERKIDDQDRRNTSQ